MLNRLKQYIDFKGITVSAFEKSIGMSNSSFGKSLKNGGSIGGDKLENILKIYSDISAEWLLTGEGEMLKKSNSNDSIPVAVKTDNVKEGIPLLPINAMAGALTGESIVMDYDCERYIVPMFKGAEFLIPVQGASMQPTFLSGDIVACRRVPMSGLFFQWGTVYVIDTDQGTLIKRIRRGADADHVLITSDNEQYESFPLPLSSIHAVAYIIGIIRLGCN